ncbi:cytochrome P450 [Aeromicrobium ginsengisoli]|uniref:Cytochrome P450 n=1 Tax=Aeromicrobium ginsengisoli TaxID=363867 RepID=A0A5M4F9B1_9ACTN|nr:cytochrome P450 [Aeromicrobium ginsengisoli]KAA1394283.1 cytochrome P450 [Aeromicrobium ginsengisoli]
MSKEPVITFDHHSAEFAHDSVQRFAELRSRDVPLGFTESHEGFWVASSYELVREILSDNDTYTVERSADGTKGGKLIPTSAKAPAIIPGILDGEPHDRLRRPLRSLFAKPNIERTVAPVAKQLVSDLLDQVVPLEEFDFATGFSFSLTVNTIFEFVGLAEVEDREKFILMLEDAFAIDPEIGADRDALAGSTSVQFAAASDLVRDVVRARVADPTEDLISKMAAPGTDLTEDDVVALTLSIILGGVRTTAASLDNMVEHLASHPDLRDELREDPSLIPSAVEEMLRLFTVTPLVARTVTTETELGGVTLHVGDRVAAVLALANLDEDQFPDPLEVDTDRSDGMHVTFGLATHYCLGLWLARMELRIALEGILERMPSYEVVTERAQRFSRLGVNNGYAHLPVRPNV